MVSQGAGKQQRPSSVSKANSSSKNSKSAGGSVRSRRGPNLSIDDTYSVPSTSPQGTLTFSDGKKTKSQKLSVVNLFANNTPSSKVSHHDRVVSVC
ncbi:hypothetical protein V1264_007201 [Littorina saxatilis]